MAKLESLIVSIEAETAELRKGLDEANKKLGEFGKSMNELAGVVEFKELGEMALELGERLTEVALKGAETAEHFVKLSQSTGIAIDDLQRLEFAAKAGGVGTDELAKGMTKLEQAVAKAAGGVTEQQALFKALGISVTDTAGKVRPLAEIIGDVTQKFAGMADGESKALLAGELLGSKNGAALIPLLNTLKETSAEADRFGAVIDEVGIRSAAGFAENLNEMRAALDAVNTRVAAELGPSLKQLTDEFLKSSTGADTLKELAESLAAALRVMATAAVVAANGFEVLGKFIAANVSALVHLVQGDLSGAADDVANFAKDAVDEFTKAGERLTALWDPALKGVTEGLKENGEAAKGSADATVRAFEAGKKSLENYKTSLIELKKLGDEEAAKVASFGLGPVDQLIAKLDSGAMTKGIKDFTGELGKARDRLIEIAKELQDLTAQHANVAITFQFKQQLAAIQQSAATSAVGFQNIGDPNAALHIAESMTGGFKDFTQALATYTEEADRAARDFADSARAQAIGQSDTAEHLKEFGEQAQKNADAAKRAADGFDQIAKIELAQTQATIEGINHALASASTMLASKLGDLGQVIQAGVQGFQSGGVYGALIAVVIELFSRFKRFAEILDIGSKQVAGLIDQISGPLSKLTDGFEEFMKMSGIIAQIVGELLGPAIREVGRTFKMIADLFSPMLNTISVGLQSFTMLTSMLEDLLDAVNPLGFVIQALAVVFNVISLTMLGTVYGIESMVDGILKAIRDAIASLFGTDNDAWRAIYDAESKVENSMYGIADQINTIAKNLADPFAAGSGVGSGGGDNMYAQLNETTQYMQVQFTGLGDAAKTTTTALQKMTEELTNVPQGFRYALEKFNATNATGGSGGTYSFGNPTVPVVQLTVQGTVVTEQNLISAVRKGLQVSNFRNNGVPHFP
jgi:hypothetical protein